MSNYTLRNISVPSSKAVVIEKDAETVLYINPYKIDPLKYKELQQVIIKFLNNDSN
ncbi:hypothetical protein [Flavobacterium sp. IMCC34518]|uniref:hypothetical protein n=1 Tax=Flavobacterium sp. IMCC34518 TaxID=3003623 RepID=UPI0022ABC9BA|nr:hypothetical protein [Flavobacterium sp. IMCC34518]